MNFTYSILKPPDLQWGVQTNNGTWTGMIRMLKDKEIDIAPVHLTITSTRSQVISFSDPISNAHNSFFVKSPGDSFNYMAYIEPLTVSSWKIVLSFVCIAPLALHFTTR